MPLPFPNQPFQDIMKKYSSYRQNEHTQKTFELVKTLVFVPPGFVLDVYNDIIKEYAKTNNVLNEMSSFTYFETTYIGKKARNGRVKRPVFPIDMWCMFLVVNKHTSTTNNSLEAFNGNFNQCQPGPQTI